jgi:sugar O-acyltransferase (sialic acid O-acetyltransferase NeuD family)
MSVDPIRIVVLGAGGNSLGILDAIAACNATGGEPARYRIEGVLDDLPQNRGATVMGHRVLGTLDEASRLAGCHFINGISSIESFRKMPDIIRRTGVGAERFASIVHPRATIAASARIGRGSAILAGCVLSPEAVVGDHVIMLENTTVNHHSRVGDYATLSAGVTVLGYVHIGSGAFIGGGSTVTPRRIIGPSAIVGAGSVVLRDIPPGRVHAGNPARELQGSRYALD